MDVEAGDGAAGQEEPYAALWTGVSGTVFIRQGHRQARDISGALLEDPYGGERAMQTRRQRGLVLD